MIFFKNLFSLFLILALFGCTSFLGGSDVNIIKTGDGQNINAIPKGVDPKDGVIGRKENAQIIASFGGVYKNRKAEIMVAQIAGKLLSAANIKNLSYNVTILDSPEINAFALPGGFIFVTRGILALANDESELAAVLAHEISHVMLRHARARSKRVETSKIVDKVIVSVLGQDINSDQGSSRSRLSLAAFSQSQELVADKEGIIIAAKANFNPKAAARFLGLLGRYSALYSGQNENEEGFLSTHPSAPDRIEKAIEIANNIKISNDFEIKKTKYLNSIDGIRFGESGLQGAVVGQKFVHPSLGFTFSVPKRYKLQNSKTSVVAVAGDDEALRFDSAQGSDEMSLSQYLQSGWVAGLDINSIKLFKNNNIEMASGTAKSNLWWFNVSVIRYKGEIYRFIFASKKNSANFKKATNDVLKSFRAVNNRDIAQIKKLSIKIIKAKAGENINSLSKKMRNIKNYKEVFLVLNNLYKGDAIIVGQQYKIVEIE